MTFSSMIFTSKLNKDESDLANIFYGLLKAITMEEVAEKSKLILVSLDRDKAIYDVIKEICLSYKDKYMKYDPIIYDFYRESMSNDKLNSIFNLNYDHKINIVIIHDENLDCIKKGIRNAQEINPDSVVFISSMCDKIFKSISHNENSLFILKLSGSEDCFSEYLNTIYDEHPNFVVSRDFLKTNYPLITISKQRKNQEGYNPISKVCNIINKKENNSIEDLEDKIYKLVGTVKNKKTLYYSYGSTEESKDMINFFDKMLSVFFPTIVSHHDKNPQNYNQPLPDYEKKLIEGDIIIFILNKKFFQSKYAMNEIIKIYIKYGNKFPLNAIFIKDNEIKDILEKPTLCDEHIYDYWDKELNKLNNEFDTLKTEEAKKDQNELIKNYNNIKEKLPEIINKTSIILDSKKIEEHINTYMTSLLCAIRDFLVNDGGFDFYAKQKSSEFEENVILTSKSKQLEKILKIPEYKFQHKKASQPKSLKPS